MTMFHIWVQPVLVLVVTYMVYKYQIILRIFVVLHQFVNTDYCHTLKIHLWNSVCPQNPVCEQE